MYEPNEKPSCDCSSVEVRRRHIHNGVIAAGQCLGCGRQVRTVPMGRIEISRLPAWDDAIPDEWRRRVVAYYDSVRAESNRAWRQRYDEYLDSWEWRQLRRKVLRRANGRCEGCGDNPASEIHHLSYERLGDELLFDLVALCDNCHHKIHGRPLPCEERAAEDLGAELNPFEPTPVYRIGK